MHTAVLYASLINAVYFENQIDALAPGFYYMLLYNFHSNPTSRIGSATDS